MSYENFHEYCTQNTAVCEAKLYPFLKGPKANSMSFEMFFVFFNIPSKRDFLRTITSEFESSLILRLVGFKSLCSYNNKTNIILLID